jgi:ankyrin repeat protein
MYNKYINYDKKYYPIFKIFIEKSNNIPSDFMEKSLNYLSGSCDFNRNYLEYLELFDLLKLAINKGVDVNTINRTKTNLLMIAAKSNNLEFAKFLIDKKINIDAKDFDGKTALSYSTSIEMNDLLIQNGAKVPSKSYYFNKVGLKTIFKKLLN